MADGPPRGTVPADAGSEGACPACGGPLFPWAEAHAFDARRDEEYVLDRCERCGTAVARSSPVHPASGPRPRDAADAEVAELLGKPAADGAIELRCPNRRSLQAAIGEGAWAALELPERPLQLTPAGVGAVLARRGLAVSAVRYPAFGRGQRWMWQTLTNALTFQPNFAREVIAGRLRPGATGRPVAFAADLVVSVLAAPLVALLSVPLEAIAALARRGGEMRVAVVPAREGAQASSSAIAASSPGEPS
ncbi:MAG TPA: hypothetical protein VFY99_07775 [Solirubrobacterales bacterium]